MITKKRNNFTLSKEAQKIMDDIPKTGKSKFVSEAIVNQFNEDKNQLAKIINPITDSDNICNHNWDFDPAYNGYCPQPLICSKCGKYDHNGFNGRKLIGY